MKKYSKVFGLLRPSVDAHSLGVATFGELLEDCGWSVNIASLEVCDALNDLTRKSNREIVLSWFVEKHICSAGFSYRLDPNDGLRFFGNFVNFLREENLHVSSGGLVTKVMFAGLPAACDMIQSAFGTNVSVFWGDETVTEVLSKIGVPKADWPSALTTSTTYDNARLQFGKDLIQSERHKNFGPTPKPNYEELGTKADRLNLRLSAFERAGQLPLFRAHVGPYDAERARALTTFRDWVKSLASGGFLDILSIGTSQLSQEAFGENWAGRPNGGGVPINSPSEFQEIWAAAQPMLVRTYSGTTNTLKMAKLYEETINIAWHALSFWWFCQTDGRGPNDLLSNLRNHFATMRFAAKTKKPLEPNTPHHFSFRGSDDVTYVLSAVLAARAARYSGINFFVLQTMLNTPKATWGCQDLAKVRAILKFLKPLKSKEFNVYLQPRAGLDYFSHDLEKAKTQLAAVAALIDDIDPQNPKSPDIIHVVSYSEAAFLATPPVIEESIQITKAALMEYRRYRKNGDLDGLLDKDDLEERTQNLVDEVSLLLQAIEKSIPNPYSPEGFYKIFWSGFLPVPQLWGARNKFEFATFWKTRMINGGMCVVDENKKKISAQERAYICAELASQKSI